MANTVVTLISAQGMLVADTGSVPVVSGNTLTIGADDGSAFVLFFSPDATNALSPKPEPAFAVPKGTKAVFTMTTSKPGSYTAFYGPVGSSAPGTFPPEISDQLYLNTLGAVSVGFGGPGGNETMASGH